MTTVTELIALANKALSNGNLLKAIEYYEIAVSKDPSNRDLYPTLGFLYGSAEDFKNTKRIGKKLMQMDDQFYQVRSETVPTS